MRSMKLAWKTFGKASILVLATFGIIFVIFEGLASGIIFSYQLFFKPMYGVTTTHHVTYDELLGWKNTPNIYLEDMYGPGGYLKINRQSFRNHQNFSQRIPNGKIRVLCSGDSFTLGVGVDNAHTWCNLLAAKDSRLETVNLGEGGYGVGQAYLKYQRDGSVLDHDIHIFAFIPDNFRRLTMFRFVGVEKPVVTEVDGELKLENVPVPPTPIWRPWWVFNGGLFTGLKSVELGRRIYRNVFPSPGPEEKTSEVQVRRTAMKIFERVQNLNVQKDSTVIFAYLPERAFGPEQGVWWERYLEREMEKRGFLFLNLVSEFRKLGKNELEAMFDPAWGHYSQEGNEFVAQMLLTKMMAVPKIARKFAGENGEESPI